MINNKNFSCLLIVFIFMASLWFSNVVFCQIGSLLTNKLNLTYFRSVVWNNAWNCRPDHLLTSALHHYHLIQKQMRYVPLCCLIFDINQG